MNRTSMDFEAYNQLINHESDLRWQVHEPERIGEQGGSSGLSYTTAWFTRLLACAASFGERWSFDFCIELLHI